MCVCVCVCVCVTVNQPSSVYDYNHKHIDGGDVIVPLKSMLLMDEFHSQASSHSMSVEFVST